LTAEFSVQNKKAEFSAKNEIMTWKNYLEACNNF